jgi:hypothetical protein
MPDRPFPVPQVLAAAVLVAAAALPQPASATRVVAQATAICQGALPAFETGLRKRPLAMQNEGGTNAFVTCSFNNPGNNTGGSRISGLTIYLQNVSAARTVSCTAVNAVAGASAADALYVTRSVDVPRDGDASTALQFLPGDFPGGGFLLPGDSVNLSCNLPPGVGITTTVLVNNSN